MPHPLRFPRSQFANQSVSSHTVVTILSPTSQATVALNEIDLSRLERHWW